jgi:hypothetical protein
LLRVISAIFSLSERKPLLAVCELVSNVFHVFSLVAAKVSNARFACSMLTLINSRNASGTSGFMNASLAMLLSCPHSPSKASPSGCSSLSVCLCLTDFSSVSSQVLTGHQAAHQKLLMSKFSIARAPSAGDGRRRCPATAWWKPRKAARPGAEIALQAALLASY